ncbi:hypothetical protein Tco_1077644 [Tanacetum coccineum]
MLTSILTLSLTLLWSNQSKVISGSLSLVPIIPSSVHVLIIQPTFVSSIFLLLEKSILDTICGQMVSHTYNTLDYSRAPIDMEHRLSAFKPTWCGLSLIFLVSSEGLNKLS